MPQNRYKSKNTSKDNPKVGKTIISDLRRGDFKRTLRQDLKDIYHFYLDQKTRVKLENMNKFKRWIFRIFWMLKSMFFKLTPARRILLVVSFILFFSFKGTVNNNDVDINFNTILLGFAVLLFILMLELKDKLLATDELLIGRKVQFALMPDHNPTLPGWEIWMYTQPANEVGGDLVDYLQITESRLGIALGDVAGKGLGAALFMAKLQATFRAIAPNYKSLADLGAEMNKIFYRDGLPSRFASLIYLELEPDSELVRIVNAGHIPPIALRKTLIEEMPQGAPALGIMSNTKYKEQHINLNPGELLLVYSDGLTEARNEQGDFFGDDWLQELLKKYQGLSANVIGDRLLTEVDRFVGNARANDDLSLVLIKRLEKTA